MSTDHTTTTLDTTTGGDISADIEAGRELGRTDATLIPVDPDQDYVHVDLADGRRTVSYLDLGDLRSRPRRPMGTRTFFTAHDFSEFLGSRLDRDPKPTIWADVSARRIVAVLNDDSPDGAVPGWRDSRAQLQLRTTPAWDRWAAHNGAIGSQEDFAGLIEEGLGEIVSPDGSTLLEIAQTMQGTTSATWRSAARLHNGQVQVAYIEEVEAHAGAQGELTIPQEFELALIPFEGSDAFRVLARLRYRLAKGKLSIGYQLDRPQEILLQAVRDVTQAISDMTDLPVWEGQP